jgi:hypothetical protein
MCDGASRDFDYPRRVVTAHELRLLRHFFSVRQSVAVRVRIGRVGESVEFDEITETVSVSVRVEQVGADVQQHYRVRQPVAVAVFAATVLNAGESSVVDVSE